MIPLELPPPDADAAAHSARLCARLDAELGLAGGWLSFARYMELVLYAPGLGYYSAGSTKFGAAGDFVTAPELSPVFGQCVAASIEAVLGECTGGEVVELGAGSGTLACRILTELDRRGRLPERYRIVEVSAELRARQASAIAQLPATLAARVSWADAPPAAPWSGVVLANEVADALPVTRFRRTASGVEELGVGGGGGRYGWRARPASAALCAAVAALEASLGYRLEPGYESEFAAAAGALVATLAAGLSRGLLLLIDYGCARGEYYAPERASGTLACFYRHRLHEDPFVRVGLQDLSAWVDFTRLAEAGVEAGLEVLSFTTQAQFLLDAGFDAALERSLAPLSGLARHAATQAALTLVLPGEMGERFKCLALGRGIELPVGFRGRDLTSRL